MDKHQQQQSRSGSPSLSSPQALCDGGGIAGAGEQSTAAGATAVPAAGYHDRGTPSRSSSSSTRPSASSAMLDNRLAPRPTCSWDSAFQTNISGGSRKKSSTGTSTAAAVAAAAAFRTESSGRLLESAAAVEARAAADADVATTSTGADSVLKHSTEALTNTSEMMGASYGKDGTMPENGADFRRAASLGTGETACPTPSTKYVPAPATVSRAAGAATSDDDLMDTDEGVMARLAEFTEMARRTAAHNEELSQELAAEKRRVAHSTRKLEQSHITCTELRESLALAQDTVVKLREHEMAWAESTASEMSLRSEMCALKDEYAGVSGDASALRKRCDVLERENAELVERFASMAEEKRQMESKARRLLRSDRYRGY
ncbi:unnamed protein product [Ectocarpus sp. 8 AP-2014]